MGKLRLREVKTWLLQVLQVVNSGVMVQRRWWYAMQVDFGLAVENNLTEKLVCKWPSGDMPLRGRLGKDPQCT